MKDRILMVMPYRQLVRKAQEEGFWVCAVWDPNLETREYLREVEDLADAFVSTDFTDQAGLRRTVRECAERYGVSRIYHGGREDSMLPVAEVAEELGRSLNPASAIRLLNDKLAMRRLLESRGLSTVRFAHAERIRDVTATVEKFGYPAIVKPTSLAGSRGVYLVHGPADLAEWAALLTAYDYPGPFLVEEYLRGPEFSVETLSHDGLHEVVGITRKELSAPPLFVEMGHVHPAPLRYAQAIGNLVVEFLGACGYRFGPAHTEVIWTAQGPRIVESQARLGGDRIPRLVELATGIDLERSVFTLLAGSPLPPKVGCRTARIAYFRLPPGLVTAVRGLDEIGRLDYVDELVFPFRPGDLVTETVDSKSRHGHVIVTGRSSEEAAERLTAVRSLLRVTVHDVPSLPPDLPETTPAAMTVTAHR